LIAPGRKTPGTSANPVLLPTQHTYDLDIQHRFSIGSRQSVLWGGSYRLQKIKQPTLLFHLGAICLSIAPLYKMKLHLYPTGLKLTVGSKFFPQCSFPAFELSTTSARLGWTMNKHTLWTAVSRAVRLPSRLDSDITIIPGLKFDSEK